jgi:uncharacterized Zn finger protein
MTPRYDNYGWSPYVPVAQRRNKGLKAMEKRRKKGLDVHSIEQFSSRAIAKTFWGKQWCSHMDSFHDFSNRLPRGKTYVRNGSVCHLGIKRGKVEAFVMGSELYEISVNIKTLPKKRWESIKKVCAGRIGSLLELLQGRLSDEIMSIVTDPEEGLFPRRGEIEFECNCPDWAVMCKHAAAVFYGVGVRLDAQPELLFLLRGVDHEELLAVDMDAMDAITSGSVAGKAQQINDGDLADIFGIDIEDDSPAKPAKKKTPAKHKSTRKKKVAKPVKKKVAKRKSVKKTATVAPKKKVAKPVKKKVAKRKSVKKTATVAPKKKVAKPVKKKVAKPVKKKVAKRKSVKKTTSVAPKKKVVKPVKKKVAKRKSVKKKSKL